MSLADVFVGEVRAGSIEQTLEHSVFTYDPDFPPTSLPGNGLAVHLPRESGPFAVPGKYMHPFFANLLPEGFRLEALRARLKVSRDDAFTLLLQTGGNTIGDVAVVPKGSRPLSIPPRFRIEETEELDFLALLEEDLAANAAIPGVQEKISSQMVSFPVGMEQGEAILKLSPPAFPLLVENEAFFMRMAAACGLTTAETRLVHDMKNRSGLVVLRFDREAGRKRHQEDGCQLLNIHPGSKYDVPFRMLAEAVRDYVAAKPIQLRKLLGLFAFSYLIGNGDLHAKNVSVYLGPTGALELTPCYDLLSTLPYPKVDQKMALKMDGRDDNWKGKDFIAFFSRLGLPERSSRGALAEIIEASPAWIDRLDEIGYDAKTTERVQRSLRRRREQLAVS